MRFVLVLAAAAAVAATFAVSAAADRFYRTEQIPLRAVGDAPGGGMVVNIHTSGPQVYAHEIYLLRHAAPGAYVVSLNVFPDSLDCTGAKLSFELALLETNLVGNGQADFMFTPEMVAAFRGSTLSISWTLVGPANTTYQSDCTVSVVD